MTLRVATCAWKIRPVRSDSGYFGHFYDIVSHAHDEGAQVLVVPELHVLELLPLARDLDAWKAARYLAQYAEAIEGWIKRISESSGMVIIGGSHFKSTNAGIRNVCAIGVPGQDLIFNEKNRPSPFEHRLWQIAGGTGLVRLPHFLGVTVGCDCEFPEAGRALAEAGTQVHCVPAWSADQRGFQRIRSSCLARAIENHTFVVHSALVGELGHDPMRSSYGSGAIIAPTAEPFPVQPILRETPLNEEAVVIADLDFNLLSAARLQSEAGGGRDRSADSWQVTVPVLEEASLFEDESC